MGGNGDPLLSRRAVLAEGCARRIAALLLAALLGPACTGREHTNPFDPGNEETHGRPDAAKAVAGCERVDLSWSHLGLTDIAGVRLWRRLEGETEAALMTDPPLHSAASSFADTAAPNEVTATYEVEFVFPSGASASLEPKPARPGAELPWCSDPCGFSLALLAPDGRAVRRYVGSGAAVLDLDIDRDGHRLFAASHYGPSAVLVADTRDPGEYRALALATPSAVSWSAASQALAVASFWDQRVTWLLPDGETLATATFPGWYPEDLAFRDPSRTWIALTDAQLQRGLVVAVDFLSGARDTLAEALVRPVAIADDPGRGCWVADRAGWVLHLDETLAATRSPAGAFLEPTDLDPAGDGTCWVADPGAGAISRIDRQGGILASHAGWPGVWSVACDTASASVWIVQPDYARVSRLDLSGPVPEVIGAIELNGCPNKVVGDWRGGCEGER